MLNGRWKFSSENKKAHAQLQIGGIIIIIIIVNLY